MNHKDKALKRSERLVALALYVQGNRSRSIREMADHFGVVERTIYRDLRALNEIGINVKSDRNRRYSVLGGYRLPPLTFTTQEAAALLLGTKFLRLCSDSRMQKVGENLAGKVRAVLPKNTRAYIDELNSRTEFDPYWLHQVPADTYLANISEAIAKRRSIWIRYYVRGRKEITERIVNPLGLVFYDDHWNLISYDTGKRDIRQFVLSYIEKFDMLARTFEPLEGFDLQHYLWQRSADPKDQEIIMRFSRDLYTVARRAIPARILEETNEGDTVMVSFRFPNLPYLASHLIRFGHKAEVLAPAALRELMQEEAQRLLELYGSA